MCGSLLGGFWCLCWVGECEGGGVLESYWSEVGVFWEESFGVLVVICDRGVMVFLFCEICEGY